MSSTCQYFKLKSFFTNHYSRRSCDCIFVPSTSAHFQMILTSCLCLSPFGLWRLRQRALILLECQRCGWVTLHSRKWFTFYRLCAHNIFIYLFSYLNLIYICNTKVYLLFYHGFMHVCMPAEIHTVHTHTLHVRELKEST